MDGLSILLVEDDSLAQEVVSILCRAKGHAVEIVADGFRALRSFNDQRYDVVLLDYHLPEMDGYALARLLRELNSRSAETHVPLIGITADRKGLAARRGSDGLFDAILVKPIQPAVLYAALDRLSAKLPIPAVNPVDRSFPSQIATLEHGRRNPLLRWQRFGLSGLPRTILPTEVPAQHAAALRLCFELIDADETNADAVLVIDDASARELMALREKVPCFLLPSIDVSGRHEALCDISFRIEEEASWLAVAKTVRNFSLRRKQLRPNIEALDSDALQLLALLYVSSRTHAVHGTPDSGYGSEYALGLTGKRLIDAVMRLTVDGLVEAEAADDFISFEISQLGADVLTSRTIVPLADNTSPHSRQSDTAVRDRLRPTPPDLPRYPVVEGEKAEELAAHSSKITILDHAKLAVVRDLIGSQSVLRLVRSLIKQFETSFDEKSSTATSVCRDAHNLISSAGFLGCERMVFVARHLELATRSGEDVAASLDLAMHCISLTIKELCLWLSWNEGQIEQSHFHKVARG
ncbi:response regulator [Methylobacterium iners]|uniref:Sensor histidine kinase RcsC n=1 Tax=Methylobacterium iners TaxID=418707 RepID=A0ABQ4S2C1_9HYPH|nr:response regulator [Methylobacterium iners]GJD95850.1 Sensor histidine kinase RcsC [Methylobacterium iners]